MDRDYPPEAEAFRKVVRAWLDQNLPDDWVTTSAQMSHEEREAFAAEWNTRLRDGGWICATWPKEYGGRGLDIMEAVVLNEEFARARAPMRADFFGETLVGPTLLQWGSEAQKAEFIPKILRGEISWCQGFSEPDAGSDLASLRTRAELDGHEWVINGQKVWTTQAQYADWCFLLARTSSEGDRHAGISYLLLPMRQPGIEVRPIAQMDGSAEFNEVFFTGARCPEDNVVGGVNNGWRVAMTTLGYERGTSATTGHRRFKRQLDKIVEISRERGVIDDPVIRQRLASMWIRCKIMEINGLRTLSDVLHGSRQATSLGPVSKMYWSEFNQDMMNLAMDILGMDGQVLSSDEAELFVPGSGRRVSRPGYPVDVLQASFFMSRADTIWGGSAQIQRNIVGERVLGLPPERKAAGQRRESGTAEPGR
jgi:alkylation response protein AidB-like acyl-CoA dehydrogenase